MEEQVAIINSVEAAHFKQECNVALEFFATDEGGFERLHDRFLFRGQAVGIGPIDRREHRIGDGVFCVIDLDGAGCGVALRIGFRAELDSVQQLTIFKTEGRVIVDQLGLNLELKDSHCLLNLDVELVLCL